MRENASVMKRPSEAPDQIGMAIRLAVRAGGAKRLRPVHATDVKLTHQATWS
jgi:hypothetical protein